MILVPVCQMHQMANSNKNYLSFYNMYKFQEDVYMKSCNSET